MRPGVIPEGAVAGGGGEESGPFFKCVFKCSFCLVYLSSALPTCAWSLCPSLG